jgi:hypothetical protein
MRSQFPNIREDGNPLILGDGWDSSRSSVQKSPKNNKEILSIGEELLTNFIGNSLNDLINEGAATLTGALSGAERTILGNVYTFNTGLLNGTNLSFNNAQNFLDNLGNNTGLGNRLATPQNLGFGGLPERRYTPPPSEDEYPTVPGGDLGVPDRVYTSPRGSNNDAYPNSPGTDLGLPQRVYSVPSGDSYPTNPGPDGGVPNRVYPRPGGDEYPTVPGRDLGVPNRAYKAPSGDEYPAVPGRD